MPLHSEAAAKFNHVTSRAMDHTTIHTLNRVTSSKATSTQPKTSSPIQATATTAYGMTQKLPELLNPTQKGQKVLLGDGVSIGKLKVCFGWNTRNPECDVDVSAFLLGSNQKVPGDDWFVFCGQTESPDGNVTFSAEEPVDRESISINLFRLDPSITKIVFVLTINDALAKHLHFGMLKDAYIRIIETGSYRELVSFPMLEYYNNVVSMMIGEIYLYNGKWKFHAIGDGVVRDLAGLCELYGVQVV